MLTAIRRLPQPLRRTTAAAAGDTTPAAASGAALEDRCQPVDGFGGQCQRRQGRARVEARHTGRSCRHRRECRLGGPRCRRSSTPTSRSGHRVTRQIARRTSTRRRPSSTSACSVRRPRSAGTCRRSSSIEHPELATWEGFKDPELAKLFATAESGRPRPVPDGRSQLRHVRRADHREPRAAAEVRRRRFRGRPASPPSSKPRPTRSHCCCSSGSRTGCSRRSS